ncbi:MAG: transposase [Chitinispirillaceae bacterium]
MSTKPRVVVPFSLYQIRSEAAPGLKLFPTHEQMDFFCRELGRLLQTASYSLVEKSLQQDHYHLVVKVSDIPISWFMRTLNSIYAKYLNKHCKRRGTVFPVRFASAVIDENCGLEEVSCHVHLNPLRCRKKTSEIVNDYIRGCYDLMPKQTRHHLEYLKRNADSCQYREIISQVRRANKFGSHYPDPRICFVGRCDFRQVGLAFHQQRQERLRSNRKRDPFRTLQLLHLKLSEQMAFRFNDLFIRGRRNLRSRIREQFVLQGIFRYEFSGADLARYMGISRSAVSRMVENAAGGSKRMENVHRILETVS